MVQKKKKEKEKKESEKRREGMSEEDEMVAFYPIYCHTGDDMSATRVESSRLNSNRLKQEPRDWPKTFIVFMYWTDKFNRQRV